MAFIHSPKIVTDGLVLCLDAGNPLSYPGSGTTWTDLSGNGNNGTLTNGPTFNSSNGGSIVFDGSNDFINIPNNTILNPTTSMMVSIWVNFPILPTGDTTFMGKGSSTGGEGGYDFRIDLITGTYRLNLVKYNVIDQRVQIPYSITTNTWYQISAVQSTNKVDYYINGEIIGTFTNSSSFQTNTVNMRIARNRDTLYTNALMNLPLMYNRTLTPQEIQQNYNATKGRFGL